MKRVVSVEQMRRAEEIAREKGLNEDIMIESAAAGMLAVLEKRIKKSDRTAVFVGGGNNGADGLSLARMLLLKGYKIEVVTVGDRRGTYNAARLKAFISLGGKVVSIDEAKLRADCYDIIVDSVFGIGLSRPPEGESLEAVKIINSASAFTVAVDMPSGLSADDGSVSGEAVRADMTVTFGGYKYGHFLGSGLDLCGEIVLVDMGIRPEEGAFLTDADCPRLPSRKKASHKGDYGRVAVIGGCRSMTGAPLLAAESALKSGAGFVTLCVAASMKESYSSHVREATMMFLPDSDGSIVFDKSALDKIMSFADSIVIGMGMGFSLELPKIISYLAENFDGILVIDADGLNALVGRLELIKNSRSKVVLTPHRGEFNRLFGKCDDSEAVEKTIEAALETGAVVVNKSAVTVITDGKEIYMNAAGHPSMAKGGSGDTLAGVIAALTVRLGALKGAARASYECGRAGERAALALGENAPTASDTIRNI